MHLDYIGGGGCSVCVHVCEWVGGWVKEEELQQVYEGDAEKKKTINCIAVLMKSHCSVLQVTR